MPCETRRISLTLILLASLAGCSMQGSNNPGPLAENRSSRIDDLLRKSLELAKTAKVGGDTPLGVPQRGQFAGNDPFLLGRQNWSRRNATSLVTKDDLSGILTENVSRSFKSDPVIGMGSAMLFYYGGVQLSSPTFPPGVGSTNPVLKTNLLFAPTIHTAGSCYEITIAYERAFNSGTTYARLQVEDACNNAAQFNPYTYFYPLDTASDASPTHGPTQFDMIYANLSGGQGVVSVAEARQPNGVDAVFALNTVTQNWDKLLDSSGDKTQTPPFPYSGEDGWSMFESHFRVGTCPSLPIIDSNSYAIEAVTATPAPSPAPVQTFSPTAAGYSVPFASGQTYSSTTNSPDNECTTNNSRAAYYYTFIPLDPGLAWIVLSNPST